MSNASEISQAGQVVYDSSTAKKINSLLNSLKTRIEGLELLNSYLPQCPDDDFIKYCVSWMQNCCKGDGFIKDRDYGIKLLAKLFQISSNYQELKKSVSFFITTRYFDYVLKYFLNSEVGWECTEICIHFYRGACGPFQETLEKHLRNEVMKNGKISSTIARCFALLPSFGGGGNENVNYQKNWKTQFSKLLNICHLILDNLFVDIEELQEYESCEDVHWTEEVTQKNPEYLTMQLYNCCTILNHMLLCQYPAPKAVPSDLVFQLICRGLAINPKSFGKQTTTDIIALQKILPEIHVILLSLLKALIVTCKNQLLPYAYLVSKLFRQSLDWTESGFSYRGEKPFREVRISAYETLCNWLVATRSGGCMETVSSVIVANAAKDISSEKDVVVLKESNNKIKQQSKEQGRRGLVNPKANDKLCFAALKGLQFLLRFVGILLKPEEHKFLQEFTVKLLVDVQKTSTSDMPVPFSVSSCRKELYSLLLELVQHPCSKWPPPTHFALRLFQKGVADECLQVSHLCSSALSVTVNLIHPQFNNEGFPTSEAPQSQAEWTSQPMEVDAQVVNSECENRNETPDSDFAEKNSTLDKSECSFEEDSVMTVAFVKDTDENEIPEKSAEEANEEPSPKKPRMSFEDKTPENEKVTPEKNPQESFEKESKKFEGSESVKSVTPELTEKESKTSENSENSKCVTPEVNEKESKKSEDSESVKSVTPELTDKESKTSENSENSKCVTPEVNEEIKPKKTYFLRSKTKASSEEPEEVKNFDNLRNTPSRSLMKATPRRQRTRVLSKVESGSETESKTTKKSEDDEDDIIAVFDDSIIE